MATAWRSRLRFREPWPLHHPLHRCYHLPLVFRLCCLIILALSFLLVEVEATATVSSMGCLQRERDALLLLKGAIKDPSARLSSWRAQVDCCAWPGVVCYNTTGSVRVAELNLQNPNANKLNESDTALSGELLHPSLLSLSHLQSLNLSFNDFEATQIPPLIGSLHKLRYLDLSWSNIGGTIPPHIGNLTNLLHLDLSSNFNLYFAKVDHNLDWLSSLSSLIHLDLSFLNLSDASYNLLSAVNMLPSLQQLHLPYCSINNIPLSVNFPLSNLTSLFYLDLNMNNFNSSFPNWLCNLTSLSSLRLSSCEIRGMLPIEIVSIPSELGNLTTLNTLSLESNLLFGPIPHEIWKLVDLEYLDLSVNSFEGDITEFHLANLTKLKILFLSGNHFLTIAIDHNWTPLFQLELIFLDSCKLGPRFPTWLRSQKSIMAINLHNTGIEDNLPEWFWNSLSIIDCLDLSHNKISGTLPVSLESLTELSCLNFGSNLLEGPIPHLPPSLNWLDLSDNAFSGSLPPTLFTPQLEYLILSHNHINGTIPSNICNFLTLQHLNLSNNQIFGEIPQCWQKGSFLEHINLGNNMLFGEIPNSLGCLTNLAFLHLNNNKLKGQLPASLQHCTKLHIVDLGGNKFSGNIPLWIGKSWQQLRILILRSNMFNGNIDPELGYLRDLQIIDFANNKLSGSIPRSFGNFTTMISTLVESLPFQEISTVPFRVHGQSYSRLYDGYAGSESITLVTKGEQLTFSSILYLVKSIDLSNNELTDEIPEELGYLVGLYSLNLSRNYFKGKIPDSIGKLSSLETLDLSFNNLSGVIPQGLSQLYALSHLNLSYNNISGNIPSGNQLQTLDDASIYIGNPYLCGDLVNKSCFRGNNTNATSEEHAMLSSMLSIYLSSALGYLIGLWSVFVVLLFKKKWRYSYFKKVDEIYDKVYVTIKIRLNRTVNG